MRSVQNAHYCKSGCLCSLSMRLCIYQNGTNFLKGFVLLHYLLPKHVKVSSGVFFIFIRGAVNNFMHREAIFLQVGSVMVGIIIIMKQVLVFQ